MKKKKGKLMYIMQWVFGLLMFGMLLYFAAGEILLQIHGAELVFALFVGTLSIIIILFGKVLHHFYSRMIRLEYLGWGAFLQLVCLIMA